MKPLIFLFLFFSLSLLLSSCDKDICRECYLIRSELAVYTDTTLADYLIPADTVKRYEKCDKEAEFKSDMFSEDTYAYDGTSIFYPRYHVHVTVTELTKCPEQQTDSIP